MAPSRLVTDQSVSHRLALRDRNNRPQQKAYNAAGRATITIGLARLTQMKTTHQLPYRGRPRPKSQLHPQCRGRLRKMAHLPIVTMGGTGMRKTLPLAPKTQHAAISLKPQY